MTALTDALRWAENADDIERGDMAYDEEYRRVVAAARLVADAPGWLQALLENPPIEPAEEWYCRVHRASGPHDKAKCWYAVSKMLDSTPVHPGPCRMVRRLLVDPGDEG